jgi:Family of unknown function (DUF5996)
LDHVLRASTSDGGRREIALFPRSVADFYTDLVHTLSDLGIEPAFYSYASPAPPGFSSASIRPVPAFWSHA